jgi:hypothetical protein
LSPAICGFWASTCSDPSGKGEMARGIGVNDRLVRRWLSGERPVSVRASMAIEGLVDDKSRLLVRDAGVSFVGAVGSLPDRGLRC